MKRTGDHILNLMSDGAEVDRAMRHAVQRAVRLQLLAGVPIVEWKDGKVKRTYPTRRGRTQSRN